MDIQLINYSGENSKEYIVKTVKKFGIAESLDMYDLNIIDLTDAKIWQNLSYREDYTSLLLDNDFKTLKNMVSSSEKSNILFVLPGNHYFLTKFDKEYQSSRNPKRHLCKTLLKDIQESFNTNLGKVIPSLKIDLSFEPTWTKIEDLEVKADFYISELDPTLAEGYDNWIASYKSQKTVSVSWNNLTVTTLQLDNQQELEKYLLKAQLVQQEKFSIPEWMHDIKRFDDCKHDKKIEMNNQKIKELESEIKSAQDKLAENNKYKSILYTSGDELVDVVKEILDEMLDIDLSSFSDKKREDIAFCVKNEYFIGEIKGIKGAVTTQHLSQLDNHLTSFVEEHKLEEDNVRRILIINTQRDRDLKIRDAVDKQQIEKATNKYGSLIVLTDTLLEMFEKFRNKELTSEQCLYEFRKKGILEFK